MICSGKIMKRSGVKALSLAVLAGCAGFSANAAWGQSNDPSYEVSVERAVDQIYNPWTGEEDTVEMRAFRGEGVDRLMAPTMRVSPGEVLRLGVQNNLAPCEQHEIEHHECYNATNIHTHGLWVSPSGNSDNVMLSINPGERFDYEFAIPNDHPAGTFWYHPHMHGATSVQLGSGMAGALIIEGNRVPTLQSPGDIDILFEERTGEPFAEQIWLFSQVQYSCFDAEGKLKAPRSPDPDTPPWKQPAWTCDAGDVGTADSQDQFGPANEVNSGRFNGINGEVQPSLKGIEAGRFQRLRMIHAGLRRPVRLSIRRLADGAPKLRDIRGANQRNWIEKYCTGEAVTQFHFADDGLTRAAIRETKSAILYPGSRFDALAYFEQPGSYCLVDDQAWRGDPEDIRVLGTLEVGGDAAPVADLAQHLEATLIEAAGQEITDGQVRARVVGDLADGFGLGSFTWHQAVQDSELTGYQTAAMTIDEHEDGTATLGFDGKPYEHDRIDRTLILGDVEQWEITSTLGRHPFHIHVNPFQIMSIRDPDGNDVTIEGSDAYDPDYAGMVGGWRDTIIVKMNYVVTMRTRYRRYVGDFVTHCHFASHGDAGMMQNIRVVTRGEKARLDQMH